MEGSGDWTDAKNGIEVVGSWEQAVADRMENDEEFLQERRWQIIQAILKEGGPDYIVDGALRHAGATLADFTDSDYNNAQVARDSDGLQKLDKVA